MLLPPKPARAARQVVIYGGEESADNCSECMSGPFAPERGACLLLLVSCYASWVVGSEFIWRVSHTRHARHGLRRCSISCLERRGWQHSGKPVRAVPRRARSHDASQRRSVGRTALHKRVTQRDARTPAPGVTPRAAPRPCPVGSTTSGGATAATPARIPCEHRSAPFVGRRRRGRASGPFRTGATSSSI